MIKRFLTSRRSGFYFAVVEEGEVHAGSEVEILSRDPHRVTVVDIVRLYLGQARDPELLHRAVNLSALPQNWKADLPLRARTDHIRTVERLRSKRQYPGPPSKARPLLKQVLRLPAADWVEKP
jgi:hypothetical protein